MSAANPISTTCNPPITPTGSIVGAHFLRLSPSILITLGGGFYYVRGVFCLCVLPRPWCKVLRRIWRAVSSPPTMYRCHSTRQSGVEPTHAHRYIITHHHTSSSLFWKEVWPPPIPLAPLFAPNLLQFFKYNWHCRCKWVYLESVQKWAHVTRNVCACVYVFTYAYVDVYADASVHIDQLLRIYGNKI